MDGVQPDPQIAPGQSDGICLLHPCLSRLESGLQEMDRVQVVESLGLAVEM